MALAVEQVRRMRGGAQSHLMRCSNQAHYVVKFQNNPQGLRILANELLGTRLAARLVAAGNTAKVLIYRPVGHYVIIAALAPMLRFLVPVLRDVDVFIADTLQSRSPREALIGAVA